MRRPSRSPCDPSRPPTRCRPRADEALTIDAATLTGNDRGTELTVTDVTGGAGRRHRRGTTGTGTGETGAARGTVTLDRATGRVVYTPADGFSGTDSFTYTVTDAAGRSTTGTVTVVVGPRATADTATATAGSTLTVAKGDGVLANDAGAASVRAEPESAGLGRRHWPSLRRYKCRCSHCGRRGSNRRRHPKSGGFLADRSGQQSATVRQPKSSLSMWP